MCRSGVESGAGSGAPSSRVVGAPGNGVRLRASELVEGDVHSDPVDPRGEERARLEAVDFAEEEDEDLLEDVGRLVAVPDDAEGGIEDAPAKSLVEDAEGHAPRRARLGEPHDVQIRVGSDEARIRGEIQRGAGGTKRVAAGRVRKAIDSSCVAQQGARMAGRSGQPCREHAASARGLFLSYCYVGDGRILGANRREKRARSRGIRGSAIGANRPVRRKNPRTQRFSLVAPSRQPRSRQNETNWRHIWPHLFSQFNELASFGVIEVSSGYHRYVHLHTLAPKTTQPLYWQHLMGSSVFLKTALDLDSTLGRDDLRGHDRRHEV